MIDNVQVYRCTGKVNGAVTYRINVVAKNYAEAALVCQEWHRIALRDDEVQWLCKKVPMQRPLYTLRGEA